MSLIRKRWISGANLTFTLIGGAGGGLTVIGGAGGGASMQRMRTDLQLNFSVNFMSLVQDLWNHLHTSTKALLKLKIYRNLHK